jgi:Bacterial archaeo-eukaryotic release factor family 7
MSPRSALELVTRDELHTLLVGDGTPAISIYVPTKRVVVQPQENSLRLKNVLPEVSEELKEHGLRQHAIDDLVAPLHDLLDDRESWTTQREGLALFRTTAGLMHFRLPFEVEEIAVVSDLPYLRPLLPGLTPEGYFYILVLSQSAARLLRATRLGFEEVDLSTLDIPLSLAEALRYDDLQKPELMNHPAPGLGRTNSREGGGRHRSFHGHGDSGEDHKSQLRRYFEALDSGICKLLASNTSPLIIAAVEYLQAIYREVSHYGNVLNEGIYGNPDRARDDQIHEQALPIFDMTRRAERNKLLERFGSLAQRDLATRDLTGALRAAYEGRVEVLLLAKGEERWGIFDPATESVDIEGERGPETVGLIDLAARQTLLHGGATYVFDPGEIPSGAPTAAIFRY